MNFLTVEGCDQMELAQCFGRVMSMCELKFSEKREEREKEGEGGRKKKSITNSMLMILQGQMTNLCDFVVLKYRDQIILGFFWVPMKAIHYPLPV